MDLRRRNKQRDTETMGEKTPAPRTHEPARVATLTSTGCITSLKFVTKLSSHLPSASARIAWLAVG